MELKIEYIPIDQLTPYENNTRKHKDYDVDTICYTSNDFVLKTNIKEPCVFDMELVYICALGFYDVESVKIVSDNLSLKEYEEGVKKCLKK